MKAQTAALVLVALILLLALGILLAPAEAQKAAKLPRIGMLSAFAPPSEPGWQQRSPFWQAMHERGWIEGQIATRAIRGAQDSHVPRRP